MTRSGALTRALERGGGGRFCPPVMFFVNMIRRICSIAVIFQYLPKNKRRTFWCNNGRLVDFVGSILKAPKVSTSVFRRADAMTGVSWRPPHRLAGPALRRPVAGGVAGGGGAGRALGVRRPSGWGGGEAASGQGHG